MRKMNSEIFGGQTKRRGSGSKITNKHDQDRIAHSTTVCTLAFSFSYVSLSFQVGVKGGKKRTKRGTQSKIKTQAHQPTDIKIGWMEDREKNGEKKKIT